MGTTLRDFLSSDTPTFAVKTASENDIDKLAADLGFDFGGSTKVAEFPPAMKEKAEEKKEGKKDKEDEEEESEKKAGLVGIDGLYDSLFPGDILGGVKTASESELTKEAQLEQDLGMRANDYYNQRWDQRIEKIAYGVLSGGLVAGHDSAHPNHMPNDHKSKGNGGKPIDLRPQYDNEIIPEHSDAIVGHEEWANGNNTIDNPKGISKKAALARRKQWLLANIDAA